MRIRLQCRGFWLNLVPILCEPLREPLIPDRNAHPSTFLFLVPRPSVANESKHNSAKQMRRFLFVFLTANAFSVFGSPLFAADNPSSGTAPASVNIYDWYKIGAYFCALANRRFYNTIDDTYKDISDLLTRAHVSDATLGAFNDWLGLVKSLPKEFSTWTMEEYDTFPNSPEWQRFAESLIKDVRKAIESRCAFWLGYHTLKLVWDVPYYQELNATDAAQKAISLAADDLFNFSTNAEYKSVFSALKPEIQNAITFIASAKKKFPNPDRPVKKPGEGLTPDDVAKIVEAAKVIHEAAKAGQLTSAD